MEKTSAKRTLSTEKQRAKRASWSTELEQLRLKMARHLDKPFQCEVCRKSFSKQLDLVQHSLATGHAAGQNQNRSGFSSQAIEVGSVRKVLF
jgi:hypothetical protein